MRRFIAGAVVIAVVLVFGARQSDAATKQFIVDPAQSSISIVASTTLFGNPLPVAAQGAGAWEVNYSGTVDADFTPDSIQLLGASLVAGISGDWKPGDDYSNYPADNNDPNGYINVTAPANYGTVADLSSLGLSSTSNSAVRELIISLADAAPKPLVGGAFDEAGSATDFTAGRIFLSAGASPPITDLANTVTPDPLVDAPGTGTLTRVGYVHTLTIPIKFTLSYPVSVLQLSTEYNGLIVATAIPEPASFALLFGLAGIGLCIARPRWN